MHTYKNHTLAAAVALLVTGTHYVDAPQRLFIGIGFGLVTVGALLIGWIAEV